MDQPQSPRSHLFTVRVWREESEQDQDEWRGKVQLLTNGEVRYFRDWQMLAALLLTMLAESQPDKEQESTIFTVKES